MLRKANWDKTLQKSLKFSDCRKSIRKQIRPSCLVAYVFICGAFLVIFGAYSIIFGAYSITLGAPFVILGVFFIILGAGFIIFGAFFIIFGSNMDCGLRTTNYGLGINKRKWGDRHFSWYKTRAKHYGLGIKYGRNMLLSLWYIKKTNKTLCHIFLQSFDFR